MFTKVEKKLSGPQLMALGFFILIFIGALLLMLPFASRDGQSTPFLTCLFTSTSASCVTGLILVDTFSHWTLFGQLVILTLIQIGGLGFITFGVILSILMHKKIGLRQRGLIQESVNALQLRGVVRLTTRLVKGTLLFEGIGAFILSIRFIPELGVLRGIYYGVFHSISAFCNGGFDLMGRFAPFSSLTRYVEDPIVNLTIIALILLGGLGFIVWNDLYQNGLHFRKYSLHTKLVLTGTFVLVFGGALGFYLLEKDQLFSDLSANGKILASFFCAVTPRTAGFNTVNNAAMSDAAKFLTTIFMFIGGCPGSTAGGVKVTTIIVLLLHLKSTLTRTYGCNVFQRRLEPNTVERATAFFCTNLFIGITATLIICCSQHSDLADTLFEVTSAISTVGMSAGLTASLSTFSKLVSIFLMYIGRLGSLSFALAFFTKKKIAHVQLPVEKISIG